MNPGSKAWFAGLCQPQWQRDEKNCSIESFWGNGEHRAALPKWTWWTGTPKSITGTQLVGHTSPWEAVSALLFLLGLLLSVASFSPVLLSHLLFASFLVLVLPQAHRGLLPLMQMVNFICYSFSCIVQPLLNTASPKTCSNQQCWDISSQHEAFERSEITVKWERMSSAVQTGSLENLTPTDHLVTNAQEKWCQAWPLCLCG